MASVESMTSTEACESTRRLQRAQDAVAAAQARHLAAMAQMNAYEDEGAGTLASWPGELRLTAGEAAPCPLAPR